MAGGLRVSKKSKLRCEKRAWNGVVNFTCIPEVGQGYGREQRLESKPMVSRRRADLAAAFRRVNKAIVATRHFALALHEQYVKKVVEAPGVHIPAPVLKGMGLCDWAWLQRNLCFCRATACLFRFWFGLLFAWK